VVRLSFCSKFYEHEFVTQEQLLAHLIDTKLQDLACPLSLFVPIAGIIGRTRLTQFLQNEKSLDLNIVNKLIGVLDEMIELKRTSLVTPDWSDAANIREQLHQRRQFKLAAEYDEDRVKQLLLEPKDGAATTQATVAVVDEGSTRTLQPS
jgi:hypothetical protein